MKSDSSKITKGVGFQRGVYAFCRTFVGPFVNIILHITYKPCKVRSRTFLCLGNHTQNLDPALMVIGTRRHMRFVANASLTRGIAGFFLNPLFGIIPREKGAKGDAAIALIEDNLRAGVSVGMFPEGNRSWDGETEYISPRTAALVKDTGVALLTYRLTGGYLLRPRWADHKRRGPMRGELVHEYTPEELAGMTVEEVYAAICRDLRVNAYEEQAASGALYRGKALAEGLQYAAYLCPHCLRFGTVETRGNWLTCSCGLTAKYLETGSFEKGMYMPFDNFAEWNRFQKPTAADRGADSPRRRLFQADVEKGRRLHPLVRQGLCGHVRRPSGTFVRGASRGVPHRGYNRIRHIPVPLDVLQLRAFATLPAHRHQARLNAEILRPLARSFRPGIPLESF